MSLKVHFFLGSPLTVTLTVLVPMMVDIYSQEQYRCVCVCVCTFICKDTYVVVEQVVVGRLRPQAFSVSVSSMDQINLVH